MQKFRIRKADEFNWVIEEKVGGHLATRGSTVGEVVKIKWVFVGYYGSLKNAALGLIDKSIGEKDTIADCKEIIARIGEAEKNIREMMEQEHSVKKE